MRRAALAVAALLCLAPLGACASEQSGDASCAAVVEADGVSYYGWGGELKQEPELTGRTVDGRVPTCDDGNGVAGGYDLQVAEIEGVPMSVAVHTEQGLYLAEGEEVPEELRALTAE